MIIWCLADIVVMLHTYASMKTHVRHTLIGRGAALASCIPSLLHVLLPSTIQPLKEMT
jgi:hypothetical protein